MSDLSNAIKQICEEKGLSFDAVITTIESALAAAYRKDYGQKNQNIHVKFDPETAKSKVFDIKAVVEDMPEELEEEEQEEASSSAEATEDKKGKKKISKEKSKDTKKLSKEKAKTEDKAKGKKGKKEELEPKSKQDGSEASLAEGLEEEEVRKFNPKTELQISDAKLVKKTAKVGDEIKTKLEVPEEYGRMAAQTAKQVIIQRLREAEREMIFNDFKDKEHEVVSGVVQRREGKIVLVDLGKAVGVLPYEEMIQGEMYKSGDRIKVFVKEVSSRPKGPEIVLSRTSDEILKKVFYLEIPEISNGLIELKAVAREAGFRSKVAVSTDSDNVDPIGSCVGQRGARIQTVIAELGGEKVDIIEYNEDPIKFIANALSPAKIISMDLNEEDKKAKVKVGSDQLSLAIGKGGQNARLAAKLTGWKIDIVEDSSTSSEQDNAKNDNGKSSDTKKDETVKDKSEDEKEEKKDKKEDKKDPSASLGQDNTEDGGKKEEKNIEKKSKNKKEKISTKTKKDKKEKKDKKKE